MTPIGQRSRTEATPRRDCADRPRSFLGRFRCGSSALLLALLCPVLLALPWDGQASELFAWWQRDFLELSLRPGDWVQIASLETADGVAHADTLECHVLDGEGARRWIGIWSTGDEDWWLLRIHEPKLKEERSVEGALEALYRMEPSGSFIEEDLSELRESQLFRRRLEDPFVDPSVSETELPDADAFGRTVRRRQVEMDETRERRIPLGRSEMLYSLSLHSVAELSPDVPIFGLLRSHMTSEERTDRFDGDGEPIGPPAVAQRTERTLKCLGFGHETPRGIPDLDH